MSSARAQTRDRLLLDNICSSPLFPDYPIPDCPSNCTPDCPSQNVSLLSFENLFYKVAVKNGYSGTKEEFSKDFIEAISDLSSIIQEESFSTFPKTGEEKSLYIDSEKEEIYFWKEDKYCKIGKRTNIFQIEIKEHSNLDDISAIEEQVSIEKAEKQDGDIAIVKTLISDNKFSYTSYIYEKSFEIENKETYGWNPMNGNYSASNIILTKNITLAGDYGKDSTENKITSIGNYRIGDVISAGTSLEAILTNMFSKRLQPEIIDLPQLKVTLYMDGKTKKTLARAVEVGTKIEPFYEASLTPGSYTYGPPTEITATSYSISSIGRKTVYQANELTIEDKSTNSSDLFNSFIADDNTNYKISASVSHNEGLPAFDNLGELAEPEIKIESGTKTENSNSITGYRAWFCGYKNGDTAITEPVLINSSQIRSLGNTANGSWLKSMKVSKMKQMFFAAPKGKGYKPSIKDASTTAPQTVLGPIEVNVEGSNNFKPIIYEVWYVANAEAAFGDATLNISKE